MTRPSVARAEKASASARKPNETTAHCRTADGECLTLMKPSEKCCEDHSASVGDTANDGFAGHV